MRVLVIYAHPDPDSLNGAIHREILTALSAAGHEVDDIDLYAEGFDLYSAPRNGVIILNPV